MKGDGSFCELVRSHFAFLVEEGGFQISGEGADERIEFVEYRSPLVYVRVMRTGPDFEPKLVFGLLTSAGLGESESYDWVDLKELDCCRNWHWQSNPDKPFNGRISELARLLYECGQSCLSGDSSVYTLMARRRDEMRRLHLREERESLAKLEAQKAWSEHRYQDYVMLLDQFRESLSAVDRSRFEYALKHCVSSCE